MDSLERDIAVPSRLGFQSPNLQIWLDPHATECTCGWHGSKLRLIPVQDSAGRLCPECLMDVGPR